VSTRIQVFYLAASPRRADALVRLLERKYAADDPWPAERFARYDPEDPDDALLADEEVERYARPLTGPDETARRRRQWHRDCARWELKLAARDVADGWHYVMLVERSGEPRAVLYRARGAGRAAALVAALAAGRPTGRYASRPAALLGPGTRAAWDLMVDGLANEADAHHRGGATAASLEGTEPAMLYAYCRPAEAALDAAAAGGDGRPAEPAPPASVPTSTAPATPTPTPTADDPGRGEPAAAAVGDGPAPVAGFLRIEDVRLLYPALDDAGVERVGKALGRWRERHEDEVLISDENPDTGRRRYAYPARVVARFVRHSLDYARRQAPA